MPVDGDALRAALAQTAGETLVLQQIRDDGADVDRFVDKVKKEDAGFGHHVYKNYDPRAAIVKKAQDVMARMPEPDPLLDVALAGDDQRP